MEHYSVSRKRKISIALITLLLHLAIILLIFMQSIKQWSPTKLSSPIDQAQEDDTYIAQELLSAGQQEPATVIFQDEAPSGDAPPEREPAHEVDLEELAQPKEVPPEPEVDMQDTEPAPEPETPQEAVPEPATLAPSNFIPQPVEPMPKKAPRPKVKRIRPRQKTNNKAPITLADISRGFMKSMHQEAGYNKSTKDMRQLTLQMYTSKIWHLIKQSFLAGENSLHLPNAVNAHTQLVLTIERSGKLVDVYLVYPKHITELQQIERLIIKRSKQTGLFPPFPPQIKTATKTFSFPLYISGQAGLHAYSMRYH